MTIKPIKSKKHLNVLTFICYALAASGVPALVFAAVRQSTMHQKAEVTLEAASSAFSQKSSQRTKFQLSLLTKATLIACHTTGGSAVCNLNDGNL